MSESIRAFFALRPDEEATHELEERIGSLRSRGWERLARFSPAENLHLTVRFLGDLKPETLEQLREAAASIARQMRPVSYQIGTSKLFPRVSRARVIVASVKPSPELRELNRELERVCVEAGLQPETFTYRPHITLARLKPTEKKRPNLPGYAIPVSQQAGSLVLYESKSGPDGAVYDPIGEFPFDGATES